MSLNPFTLFGLLGAKPKTYTVKINQTTITAPLGVRLTYRRNGNARRTLPSRLVSGNARRAA